MARRERQRKSVFSLISWSQRTVRFRNPLTILSAVRDIAAGGDEPESSDEHDTECDFPDYFMSQLSV